MKVIPSRSISVILILWQIRARIGEMTFYLQGPLMDVIWTKNTRLIKLKGLNVTLTTVKTILMELPNINKPRKYINLKHLIVYSRRQVLFACLYT